MDNVTEKFNDIYESIGKIENMLNILPPDINVAPILYELEENLKNKIVDIDKIISR